MPVHELRLSRALSARGSNVAWMARPSTTATSAAAAAAQSTSARISPRLCASRSRLGHAFAPGPVREPLSASQSRACERKAEEREPHAHLCFALTIERKTLHQLRPRELERRAGSLGGRRETTADAVRHRPEREQEQLLLVGEVVHDRARRPSPPPGRRAGRSRPRGHRERPGATPRPQLGSSLLVIYDLRHLRLSLYRTSDIKQEMELKWILAIALEAAFWLMLAAFLDTALPVRGWVSLACS